MLCCPLQAQRRGGQFFEVSPRFGSLFERRPIGDKLGETFLEGVTLGIGRQAGSDAYWKQYFHNPSCGVRFGYTRYTNDIYGDNLALYPFLQLPMGQWGRFSLETGLGLGMAWHLKSYNPQTNPLNTFIGMPFSAAFHLSLTARYQLSRHVDLFGEATLSHFSNGAVCMPNRGTNALSGQVGVRVYRDPRGLPERIEGISLEKPRYPKNEIYTFFAPSFEQEEIDKVPAGRYFCATWQVGYFHRFHPCFKAGVAADLFYLGYLNDRRQREGVSGWRNVSAGLTGQFQVLFGDLALHVGLGFSTERSFPRSDLYERIGLFYYFGKRVRQFAGLSIKAFLGAADYIEWTYGITMFRF